MTTTKSRVLLQPRSSGIVGVLADMKDKAESELSDLRRAENNAQHNCNMLKQSLEDQIKADSTDLKQEQKFPCSI